MPGFNQFLVRSAAVLAVLAVAMLALPVIAAPATAQAAARIDMPHAIDIPAGPLVDAIDRLRVQSGVQIMYETSLARRITVPALQGTFTVRAALAQLLANTGLQVDTANEKTVVLRRADPISGRAPADQMQVARADAGTTEAVGKSPGDAGAKEMVVEGARERVRAGGNLDLPRSEDDPLPYQVFTRDDIQRSGAVELNTFLSQYLLQSDPTPSYSASPGWSSYYLGSNNLNLRGYGSNQTVVLVNGRRLPQASDRGLSAQADINAIPVNLIERVEILPASASALYGADAVGGVINIILRPGFEATEVTLQYDNAAHGYDAPSANISFVHQQSLLDGRLDVRVGGNRSSVIPPTEDELGYRSATTARRNALAPPAITTNVRGATPNIRSASNSPLFGPGTSSVTSVAPGSDGLGGLADFAGREGVRNFEIFDDGRGRGLYGSPRERESYYFSTILRATPWLDLSLDGRHDSARVAENIRLLAGNFTVPADSPFNPFGQAVVVWLHDYPRLSQYTDSPLDYVANRSVTSSASFGALIRLPREWKLAADLQYSRSDMKYRTYFNDSVRWNQLIAEGLYNPFRDTQVYAPSQEFIDRVVTFRDQPGTYVYWGGYRSKEVSLRAVNEKLPFPTGDALLVIGGNYLAPRINPARHYDRYGDGTLRNPELGGFSATRLGYQWGVYAELQAPLVPQHLLPKGLRRIDGDIAFRYAGSNTYKRSPNPPTVSLRADFAGGISLRSSYTMAFRPPSPAESIPTSEAEPRATEITDPARGGERYSVMYLASPNPDLLTEEAKTLSVGVIFQRGELHRFRASLDYLRTDKTNELTSFSTTSALTNEQYYPERVQREAPDSGDPYPVGRVTFIRGGAINVLGRKSADWTGAFEYSHTRFRGGVLTFDARGYWFQTYRTQLLPTAPVVENIDNPDASFAFLKYRANAGVRWSGRQLSLGADARYYHSKVLPRSQWVAQGGSHLDRYTEMDVYVQSDLSQWMPRWMGLMKQLNGQLRINNVLDRAFPYYSIGSYGVQSYGDWRGRVYGMSLTASF